MAVSLTDTLASAYSNYYTNGLNISTSANAGAGSATTTTTTGTDNTETRPEDTVELSKEVQELLKQLANTNQDSSVSQLLGTGTNQGNSLIGTLLGNSNATTASLKGQPEASLFANNYSAALQAAYNGAAQKAANEATQGNSRVQDIVSGYNSYLNSLSANAGSTTGTNSIIS